MIILLIMDLYSLLSHCLQLLASNNKALLRNTLCDALDLLDNELEDIAHNEDIANNEDTHNEDPVDDDDIDSVASDDIPFSVDEMLFIKNKAHYNYLIKYSLTPTYLHQYYKPFMDNDIN